MACAKAIGHGCIQSCLWAFSHAVSPVSLPRAAFPCSPPLLDVPAPHDHLSNFSLFQISPRRSQSHDSLHILFPQRLDIPEVGILSLEIY